MALTKSNILMLNTQAPDFALTNVFGQPEQVTLSSYAKDSPVIIAFICNHCPYVLHIIDKFVEVVNSYASKGIKCIAISSNNIEEYPEDSPDKMTEFATRKNFNFPYCYDETQAVAKTYDATCTPDIYLFNAAHTLVYHGQFDNSRLKTENPVLGTDLINAINNVLQEQPISSNQYPSMGCNIKWKN